MSVCFRLSLHGMSPFRSAVFMFRFTSQSPSRLGMLRAVLVLLSSLLVAASMKPVLCQSLWQGAGGDAVQATVPACCHGASEQCASSRSPSRSDSRSCPGCDGNCALACCGSELPPAVLARTGTDVRQRAVPAALVPGVASFSLPSVPVPPGRILSRAGPGSCPVRLMFCVLRC